MPSRSDTAAPPLAGVLATARTRAGVSLAELGEMAGTSASHLSRLERGERTGVSPALLERLARALHLDPAELLAPAGVLAGDVTAALSDPGLAKALGPEALPPATRDALRRLHIAAVAEDWRLEANEPPMPVDPSAVLRAHRLNVYLDPSSPQQVRFPDGAHVVIDPSGGAVPTRFLAAHAAGHAALESEPSCNLDSQSEAELDATAFAGFLLAPRGGILQASRQAAPSYDVWQPESASRFITEVAERLGMPAWLAARRMAEDGRLAEAADRGER